MTPLFLNSPPLMDLNKEDHQQHDLQLFLTPHHHHAPTTHQDQEVDDKCISRRRWSSTNNDEHINFISSSSANEREGSSSLAKWNIPSNMNLMQQIINPNCSSESVIPVKFTVKIQSNPTTNNIRVCSDCNTTTTPLWRSGPRGPKSLCNACGIRQRKARRAMAAIENGTVVAMETSSSSSSSSSSAKTNYKLQYNKEKKSRSGGYNGQGKKFCKSSDHQPSQTQKKHNLKDLALSLSNNSALQRVLPQDVEEAAILLMELSCGFIHT